MKSEWTKLNKSLKVCVCSHVGTYVPARMCAGAGALVRDCVCSSEAWLQVCVVAHKQIENASTLDVVPKYHTVFDLNPNPGHTVFVNPNPKPKPSHTLPPIRSFANTSSMKMYGMSDQY